MNTVPSWYYDEFNQKGENYDAIAEQYDGRMQRIRNIAEETEKIKDYIDLQKDDVLLEIGTGTGLTALALAKYCDHITAIDISDAMLTIAKNKAKTNNIKTIEFLKGGFLTYDFPEKHFNKVITLLSLHHLPDFWKFVALKRIHNMLIDNGLLLIMDIVFRSDIGNPMDYFNNMIRNINNYSGEDVAKSMEIRIKELYPTFDCVMEGLIQSTGFKLRKNEKEKEFVSIYVCQK